MQSIATTDIFSTFGKESHMPYLGFAIFIFKVLVKSLACFPSFVLDICSKEENWICFQGSFQLYCGYPS